MFVYQELFSSSNGNRYGPDDLTPVNWVLLAVVAGILGLVLSGFTIWHLSLVGSGMTTIESLEKVRYNSPSLSQYGPPPPEGAHYLYEDPDYQSRRENMEAHQRYNAYLMEETSKNLPHAFDLGRSRNFAHVFGGRDQWPRWFIPAFSGVGDGWNWETSDSWKIAVEAMKGERERLAREQDERERRAGWGGDASFVESNWRGGNPHGLVRHASDGSAHTQQSKAERILGRAPGSYSDHDLNGGGEGVPLRRMSRHLDEGPLTGDDPDDDEDLDLDLESGGRRTGTPWASWGPHSAKTDGNSDRWV